MTTPPFGSSSLLENRPNLMSAGPAPGVPLVQELFPGEIWQLPGNLYGMSSVDDGFWTNVAWNYLTTVYGNGTLHWGPYTYTGITTIVPPYNCRWLGHMLQSVYNYLGSQSGFNLFDPVNPQSIPLGSRRYVTATIDGITIDGVNNTNNGVVGALFEDISGVHLRLQVRNFTGASDIGVVYQNNRYSLNDFTGSCFTTNCTIGQAFIGGTESVIEHMDLTIGARMSGLAAVGFPQIGIKLTSGAQLIMCDWRVNLAGHQDAGPYLFMDHQTQIDDCCFNLRTEISNGGGTPATAQSIFWADSTGAFNTNWGHLSFDNLPVQSNISSQHFGFSGLINGDTALKAAAVSTWV